MLRHPGNRFFNAAFLPPRFLAALLLALGLAAAGPAAANLEREQSRALIEALQGEEFVSLEDFLARAADTEAVAGADAGEVIRKYLDGDPLSEQESYLLHRLTGIYARLKYGQEAIDTLERLVAIPTFQVEGLPQHENPEFHRFAAELETIATDFGLAFRNVDDRVYEITLEGSGEELLGLHAHADVVPVNRDLWVLEDGTRLDPFQVTRIGDRMYGRGTEDDKNGIVVALYAMRVIKEEGLPLRRDLRLLVDTTEETSSDAIPYYFARNPVPAYNLALDGSYPVVIAEKGFGTVMASFPARPSSGEGAELTAMTGGLATNQIPSTATATFLSGDPASLAAAFEAAGTRYAQAQGGDFSIDAQRMGGQVLLRVRGVSAHSSDPGSGVNPVSRMMDFLYRTHGDIAYQNNHLMDAVGYAAENFGLDYRGERLGIAHEHEFMGPLTAAVTFIGLDGDGLRLATNLRVPAGVDVDALREEIGEKLRGWAAQNEVTVEFDVSIREPMYRDPEGDIVNALLDVATENLGLPRRFGSSSGSTSIHDLPNGMQFGLSMPEVKYTGHNANEFKTVEQFMLDLRIVTEMMMRIGNHGDL